MQTVKRKAGVLVEDAFSHPCVPLRRDELMGDPEKSKRVTNAMLKMQKIIVADLQKAHGG